MSYDNVFFGPSDDVEWPLEIYTLVNELEHALVLKNRERALALLSRLEQSSAFVDGSLNALSKLELLGNVANAYIRLEEYAIAVLKMEDVCDYAAKIDPRNIRTALDYRKLAQLRERNGDLNGAMDAIDRGIRTLEGVKGFTRSIPLYTQLDDYRSRLRAKIEELARGAMPPALRSGNGFWRRLRDLFSRRLLMTSAKAGRDNIATDRFWLVVRDACVNHVRTNVEQLKNEMWPHMPWAEQRYYTLVSPEQLDAMLNRAQWRLTAENGQESQAPVDFVGSAAGWHVMVSVHASARDKDFLTACPGGSFEELERRARADFHKVAGWFDLDFAHWILLVDEQRRDASIHLHTMWSFAHFTQWLGAGEPSQSRAAPVLAALNLMGCEPREFLFELLSQDQTAYLIQRETERHGGST